MSNPTRPCAADRRTRRLWLLTLAPFLVLGPLAAVVAAQDSTAEDPASEQAPTPTGADDDATATNDEALALGAEVYQAICSACHQPGGTGVGDQFPPLRDNPHVADAAYVEEVIRNGREGEIVVGDQTFNGKMPAFSTLTDDEIDSVIVYIQSGFQAPSTAPAAAVTGPVAGTELPGLANMTHVVAVLIAVGVGALVLGPRLTSSHDRLTMPWFDAWLKTAVIVAGFVFFTVYVPNWVLQSETVSGLDRIVQDVIGSALWIGGLGGGIWALWYAARDRRV